MAAATITAHTGKPASTRAGQEKARGFILFFFALVFLQLALPGVEMVAGPAVGAVTRIVEILFLMAGLGYVACHASFFFNSMPGLLVSIFFLISAFYASELFSNKNFLYASFEVAKLLTPYFAFMAIYRFAKKNPALLLKCGNAIVVACYMLALVGICLFPDNLIRGRGLAPAYFGGGMHTSGYVICLAGLCAYVLWKRGALGGKMAACFVLATLALITVIWNVRTTIVLFLVFFFVHYWHVTKRVLLPAVVVLLAGAMAYAFLADGRLSTDALIQFSSGRLSMWGYKLRLLSESTLLAFLFGNGIGSDFVVSDIWWWGAKDSHNDYLHIMTELGLTGLVLFVVMVLAQRAVLPRNESMATALMFSYLTASLLSNGLIFRPLPSLLFALALGLTALPPGSEAKK